MRNNGMLRPFLRLITGCILLFPHITTAAISTWAYCVMQTDAPEKLSIVVQSVSTTGAIGDRDVTVSAHVNSVERSVSGTRAGDTITIRYHTAVGGPPVLDAWLTDIPHVGDASPAFLNKDGNTFSPAAGEFSFSPMLDLRSSAGEVLVLNITAAVYHPRVTTVDNQPVDSEDETYYPKMDLTATVGEVRKSLSGRRVGDQIHIHYTIDYTSPPRTIAACKTYVAYLNPVSNSKDLMIGAGPQTFELVGPTTQPSK